MKEPNLHSYMLNLSCALTTFTSQNLKKIVKKRE